MEGGPKFGQREPPLFLICLDEPVKLMAVNTPCGERNQRGARSLDAWRLFGMPLNHGKLPVVFWRDRGANLAQHCMQIGIVVDRPGGCGMPRALARRESFHHAAERAIALHDPV